METNARMGKKYFDHCKCSEVQVEAIRQIILVCMYCMYENPYEAKLSHFIVQTRAAGIALAPAAP